MVLLAVVLVVSVTEWALTFSARRTMTEPVVVLPAGEVDPQTQLTDVAPIARLFGAASSADRPCLLNAVTCVITSRKYF